MNGEESIAESCVPPGRQELWRTGKPLWRRFNCSVLLTVALTYEGCKARVLVGWRQFWFSRRVGLFGIATQSGW